MPDLFDVLDSAAGPAPAVTPDVVSADLRRGRRALLRRRYAGGSAALLLTGAAVLAGVTVLPDLGSTPAGSTRITAAAGGSASGQVTTRVPLVPFGGALHGALLAPKEVPEGWTVAGTPSVLLVAPPGSTTGTDDFTGKLVVYVQTDPVGLPKDAVVPMGDRTGYAIRSDHGALQVWVPLADGTALRAQAPPSLGWDEATLGALLGGVRLLPGATGTAG